MKNYQSNLLHVLAPKIDDLCLALDQDGNDALYLNGKLWMEDPFPSDFAEVCTSRLCILRTLHVEWQFGQGNHWPEHIESLIEKSMEWEEQKAAEVPE